VAKKTTHRRQSGAGVLCGASLAAILGFGAACALAQTSGTEGQATTAAQEPELNEIIVTAGRRSETVQNAPQSITAISGEQLQAGGISSLEQIGAQVPGISERNGGPGQTEYEMRGVSSAGGSAPTVGFYLDDVSLTSPANSEIGKTVIDPSLYDLNRVEVLRGPQGTLYGSSSMGGTIRLITNQPNTHELGASVQVTGSGTDGGGGNGGVNAMLNIPLIEDKLALRIVGTESYTSGWIDRIVLDNFPPETNNGSTRGNVLASTPSAEYTNSNWERLEGGRASLLWQPSDNLTVSPTAMYQKITQGGPNEADVPPGVSHEVHYQPFDIAEPFSDEFKLFTLPIKYKLGDIQFDSISAYYNRHTQLAQDNSEYGQNFLETYIVGGPVTYAQAGPFVAYDLDTTSQYTQEFRVASGGEGPFQWLAGFYYQDFKSTTTESTSTTDAYVTDLLGTNSWYYGELGNRLKQYAGFGEASYKLADFKLTAGLRYYSYSTVGTSYEYGGVVNGEGPAGAVSSVSTGAASGTNPRINLSYIPTRDLTLYLQIAKGFRPGEPLPPAPAICGRTPSQYSPDDVWSYEVGEKSRFLDGLLTLNASAYYEVWDDIQQNITIPCGYNYTSNAGTAHIYGSEVEASFRFTPEIALTTGLGYTEATLSSVPPSAEANGFFVGEPIQEVPKWMNTTSLVYTRRVSDDYNLVFRATNEYVGEQEVVAFSLLTVPAHDFVNLRFGLSSEQRVSVWLFANNLTDARANLNAGAIIGLGTPVFERAVTNQPRTIGVELNYAFGGR
jgi:iron complex outermembrane receptor protein